MSGCVTEKDEAKAARSEMKAKAKLTLRIDPVNFSHLQVAKTAKERWENLGKAFVDNGLLRRVGLLTKIIYTKLVNCASIEQFAHTIISTGHKLECSGMDVDGEWIGTLLLAGLSE